MFLVAISSKTARLVLRLRMRASMATLSLQAIPGSTSRPFDYQGLKGDFDITKYLRPFQILSLIFSMATPDLSDNGNFSVEEDPDSSSYTESPDGGTSTQEDKTPPLPDTISPIYASSFQNIWQELTRKGFEGNTSIHMAEYMILNNESRKAGVPMNDALLFTTEEDVFGRPGTQRDDFLSRLAAKVCGEKYEGTDWGVFEQSIPFIPGDIHDQRDEIRRDRTKPYGQREAGETVLLLPGHDDDISDLKKAYQNFHKQLTQKARQKGGLVKRTYRKTWVYYEDIGTSFQDVIRIASTVMNDARTKGIPVMWAKKIGIFEALRIEAAFRKTIIRYPHSQYPPFVERSEHDINIPIFDVTVWKKNPKGRIIPRKHYYSRLAIKMAYERRYESFDNTIAYVGSNYSEYLRQGLEHDRAASITRIFWALRYILPKVTIGEEDATDWEQQEEPPENNGSEDGVQDGDHNDGHGEDNNGDEADEQHGLNASGDEDGRDDPNRNNDTDRSDEDSQPEENDSEEEEDEEEEDEERNPGASKSKSTRKTKRKVLKRKARVRYEDLLNLVCDGTLDHTEEYTQEILKWVDHLQSGNAQSPMKNPHTKLRAEEEFVVEGEGEEVEQDNVLTEYTNWRFRKGAA